MTKIFSGRLLKLLTKKVHLPNGNDVTLEIIRHPGAGLVIPFLTGDKVVMLEQLRPAIGTYMYELPAGTLNKGETPLACCRREIVEETGYRARKFRFLGAIYPVPGYSTEKIHIYAAYGLTPEERKLEADEVLKIRSLPGKRCGACFAAEKSSMPKPSATLPIAAGFFS